MEIVKDDKLTIDSQLLSSTIIELNIARRNIPIYPVDHQIVKTSIERAYNSLVKLFKVREDITMSLARDALIVDEHLLDKKNPVFEEFTLSLYNIGISSLKFMDGLTKEELVTFLMIITHKKQDEFRECILNHLLEEKNINHIGVDLVDYSAFHMVKNETTTQDSSENVWEKYVYGLIEGKLIKEEEIERLTEIPPDSVAKIINKTMSKKSSPATYERVITSYLRKTSEKKTLEGTSFLHLMNVINHLKPGLKKQFLSMTYNTLSTDPASTMKMLESLPYKKLLNMLEDINKNGKLIPEALKKIVEKYTMVNKKLGASESWLSNGQSLLDDFTLSTEIDELFLEEEYGWNMSDEYKSKLDRAIKTENHISSNEFFSEKEAEASDDYLEIYANNIIIDLIEKDYLRPEECRTYLKRLTDNALYMIEIGQFREVAKIIDVLREQIRKNQNKAAEEAFHFIVSKSFIKRLLREIRFWGRQRRAEVFELCSHIKNYIIAPLMHELSIEENTAYRKFYLSILVTLGEEVVDEAIKRLKIGSWFVIRNMIFLIRECGTREHIDVIKSFCRNNNPRIRIEAMKAMLHFKHYEAEALLMENLEHKNEEMQSLAINLAGLYRVRSLVPLLVKMLDKKILKSSDLNKKIAIIDALGKIRDPGVVKSLGNFLKKKSLLYKNIYDQIKVVTIKSLINYEYDSVRPLLEEGLKSDNKAIRSMSHKVMRGLQR